MNPRPLPHMNQELDKKRDDLGHLGWTLRVKAELLERHALIGDDDGIQRDIRGIIDLVKATAAVFKDLEKLKEDRFSLPPEMEITHNDGGRS